MILASTLTTTGVNQGWNAINALQVLSANNGIEHPHDDYEVSISPDGQNILATWTSRFAGISGTQVNGAYSIDGGASWITNLQISP